MDSVAQSKSPKILGPLGPFGSVRLFFVAGKVCGLHARGATSSYIVPLPRFLITLLFSKSKSKRKDFQEIARLA